MGPRWKRHRRPRCTATGHAWGTRGRAGGRRPFPAVGFASGAEAHTNQRMEINAALEAVRALETRLIEHG